MDMRYIHYQVQAGPDQLIQVNLDAKAYVRVLDEYEFSKYQKGKTQGTHSILVENGIFQYRPHRTGLWHVIVDLDGLEGQVNASVDVFST
jgi:hypothetical protein